MRAIINHGLKSVPRSGTRRVRSLGNLVLLISDAGKNDFFTFRSAILLSGLVKTLLSNLEDVYTKPSVKCRINILIKRHFLLTFDISLQHKKLQSRLALHFIALANFFSNFLSILLLMMVSVISSLLKLSPVLYPLQLLPMMKRFLLQACYMKDHFSCYIIKILLLTADHLAKF